MIHLLNYHNSTPKFKWYVIWCGVKNGYPKDNCLKEIGMHAHNMIIILGLIANIIEGWGGTYKTI